MKNFMSKNLREQYFEQFSQNCLDAVALTKIKNQGYTGGTDDPFSNFRFASTLATLPGETKVSVAQTILSRMADKISRFKSLTIRPDYATADESVLDTLRDLFVYANILLAWEQLGHPEPGQAVDPEPTALAYTDLGDMQQPDEPPNKAIDKLKSLFNWK